MQRAPDGRSSPGLHRRSAGRGIAVPPAQQDLRVGVAHLHKGKVLDGRKLINVDELKPGNASRVSRGAPVEHRCEIDGDEGSLVVGTAYLAPAVVVALVGADIELVDFHAGRIQKCRVGLRTRKRGFIDEACALARIRAFREQ